MAHTDNSGQPSGAQTSPRTTGLQLNKPITANRHTLPNRLPSTSETSFAEPHLITSPKITPHSTNPIALSPKSTQAPTLNKADQLPYSSISSNASSSRSRRSSVSVPPLSSENLIDVMEKEQEGIVLKLMKEIQTLKEENKQLKQQLVKFMPVSSTGSFSSASNSSSLSRSSSQRRSTIAGSVASSKRLPSVSNSVPPFNSFYDNQSYDIPDFRTSKTRKKTSNSPTFANYSLTPVARRDSFASDKLGEDLSPLCIPSESMKDESRGSDERTFANARYI
ncbi:hypothetical protein OGAPHI_006425 [Ogataea philodendri]|uniref:Uncharacterized protein n=1 Tax=Ogataea philodendri TaxID=1378263 RepID=A0A9P8NXW4_9ASCO|nr:uncharacterized protein OGAPHI_006425 [Ogataea philodendri]KAH3661577.1 hypothetical protein OGAPHI_006425 [Ogataea philodendri]